MTTETKTRTIMDVAGEMYNNMEWDKRSNGDKFIKCTKDVNLISLSFTTRSVISLSFVSIQFLPLFA